MVGKEISECSQYFVSIIFYKIIMKIFIINILQLLTKWLMWLDLPFKTFCKHNNLYQKERFFFIYLNYSKVICFIILDTFQNMKKKIQKYTNIQNSKNSFLGYSIFNNFSFSNFGHSPKEMKDDYDFRNNKAPKFLLQFLYRTIQILVFLKNLRLEIFDFAI